MADKNMTIDSSAYAHEASERYVQDLGLLTPAEQQSFKAGATIAPKNLLNITPTPTNEASLFGFGVSSEKETTFVPPLGFSSISSKIFTSSLAPSLGPNETLKDKINQQSPANVEENNQQKALKVCVGRLTGLDKMKNDILNGMNEYFKS